MPSENEYLIAESALKDLKEWFSRYVQSFYSVDPIVQEALLLKEKHSLRVCNEILDIGKQLVPVMRKIFFARLMMDNS